MNNPYAGSLETQILSATPVELIGMLYQGALASVRDARQYLAEGKIFERGRQVAKAVAILAELSGSLDLRHGGELPVRLAGLYDYMQRALLDSNFRQSDDGLAASENILLILSEAWSEVTDAAGATPAALPAIPVSSEYSASRHLWSA